MFPADRTVNLKWELIDIRRHPFTFVEQFLLASKNFFFEVNFQKILKEAALLVNNFLFI